MDATMLDNAQAKPPVRRLVWLLWILAALCVGLVLPYLAEQVQYSLTRGQLRARADAAGDELERLGGSVELVKLSDTSKAFRLVAQRVEPSVVHIDTQQRSRMLDRAASDEGWDMPFFRGRPEFRSQGQGSGVIVDQDGYVVTNYHVIQGADVVDVKLSDGRIVSAVKVVGYDILTDLAVLKIDTTGLVSAAWGDSRELEVGDWVLAVGNPYGLDRTVTSGIISGKERRRFAQNAHQDFLQTDAAVNPGNSGGPLVNIRGEVVGITTAIVGSAYQGISFAIPSEVVRDVYQRLRSEGKVARGWLGVQPVDISAEIAKELKLPSSQGALLRAVLPGSPAAAAGLLPGDVVVQWNGQDVRDASELPLMVAATDIGSKAKVGVIRNGAPLTLELTVGERPDEDLLRR